MRITVLADQHGELPDLPKCDLLILSGDLTGGNRYGPRDGTESYWNRWLFAEFRDWLRQQRYEMAVAVGGNHDTCLVDQPALPSEITYLRDAGCSFRRLKIWGAPWVCEFDDLAFGLPLADRAKRWARVPDDTDILVCHGPPYLIGDRVNGNPVGCLALRQRIEQVRPKLVTCGHIHEGHGIYRHDQTVIINAARRPVTFSIADGK